MKFSKFKPHNDGIKAQIPNLNSDTISCDPVQISRLHFIYYFVELCILFPEFTTIKGNKAYFFILCNLSCILPGVKRFRSMADVIQKILYYELNCEVF